MSALCVTDTYVAGWVEIRKHVGSLEVAFPLFFACPAVASIFLGYSATNYVKESNPDIASASVTA